jgi:hypothetical protein
MPREDRRIIFDYQEVYKAIYALSAQKQLPKPPPGIVKTIEEDTGDINKIYVTLENPQQQGTPAKMEYSRDFLAAALMIFCKGHGIPLPKSAQKSVMMEGDTVILRVQI